MFPPGFLRGQDWRQTGFGVGVVGRGGQDVAGTAPGRSGNAHTVSDGTLQGRPCHPKLTQLLQTESTQAHTHHLRRRLKADWHFRGDLHDNVTLADPETLTQENAAV